ncbi:MAG: hypothetical protein JEZ00_12540 [Anaerolineaceae bacterium]|nr:hypothetical protein [Anaerolineaceae bacterium]
MIEEHNQNNISDQISGYQIRINGHLNPDWTDWFEGLTITREDGGTTVLTGEVLDQAALYGTLKRIRDLGMNLVSLNPIYGNIIQNENF